MVLLALSCAACSGPLGPFPGGQLEGVEHTGAVTDWGFAADVEVVQLETNPAEPHSVNTWIAVVDNRLYIATSLILGAENPAERDWVKHVLADPRMRLRIVDKIYPAKLTRVADAAEATRIKQILLNKYGEDSSEQSATDWVFAVTSR